MKTIRFIDSRYNDKFEIPDGGRIILKSDNRKKFYRCQYIDNYHFKIFGHGRVFHICEFAEIMEKNGTTYEPADIEPK